MNYREAKVHIHRELSTFYPENEIQSLTRLLFEDRLQIPVSDYFFKQEKELSSAQTSDLQRIISRLKNFEPIQYIVGKTEFYGLNFELNPAVLIPRPETEELVDRIVERHKNESHLKIADLGTGSGCIAVSLAKNLDCREAHGFDISEEALKIARKNSESNQTQVIFFSFDLLKDELPPGEKYDLIVSNPPYVCRSEQSLMQPNVLNHEPHSALFVPDSTPLLFYEAIADFARKHLKKGGSLYLEINENLGRETRNLLIDKELREVEILKDLQKKDRFLHGKN